jgi:protein phosphatase
MAALRRRSFALTDVGRRRPTNEDAFVADDTLGLYAVADGVGGNAKGEVASNETVDQLRNFVCSSHSTIEAWARLDGTTGDEERAERKLDLLKLLESAVQSACYLVFAIGQQDPEGRGMSTTLSAMLLSGRTAFIAQVGDSRVYHLRDGRATQVTDDHTLINHKLKRGLVTPEEAAKMKGKNVITRAVGHRDYVQVDTLALDLAPGDRLLVCSDGLHGYLKPGEAERILAAGSVEDAVTEAIALANGRGGKDNVTAVVVGLAETRG